MNELIAILIPLLIQIESGGNNRAVGDGGLARGCLQIHKQCWEDGCRFLKKDWDYKTMSFDREKSIKIASAYLLHYGRYYEKKTHKKADLRILSMIYNGGPFAYRENHKYHKKASKYADKVMSLHNKRKNN